MKRTPLPRRSKPLKRSTTPIRQVNPTAKAKRVKKQKAHYASAEYKAARKGAMKRAGEQCEVIISNVPQYERDPRSDTATSWGVRRVLRDVRCDQTAGLEAHHLRYPSYRPLDASDLLICCRRHHQMLELRDHPTRHPR